MEPAREFLDAFNDGDLDRLRSLMADGYTYTDRFAGGRLDADQHHAVLQQVLASYPDRRIELRDRLDGQGTTMLVGTWSGMPAAGGQPMTVELALLLSTDGAQVREGTAYYVA